MKFIYPLSIHSITTTGNGVNKFIVIQIQFDNKKKRFTCQLLYIIDVLSQFFKNMYSTKVLYCMNSIQPERINMKISKPHQCIFNKIFSYTIAPCIVEIDSIAPGCFIFIGEIWPVCREIISFRPHVVIYNIQNHSNAMFMACVYQILQAYGAAIRTLSSKRIN